MELTTNKSFRLKLSRLSSRHEDGKLTGGTIARKSDGTLKLVRNGRPFVYEGDRCSIVEREFGYALKDLDSFGSDVFELSEEDAKVIFAESIEA